MTDLLAVGVSTLELTPPDGRRLETATRLRLGVTGPESNVAVAAVRLGASATWASALPATPLGRRVAGAVARHGVETAVSWREESEVAVAFVERAGEPRGDRFLRERTGTPIEPGDLEAPDGASMVYISGATAVHAGADAARAVFAERPGATAVLGLSRPQAIEAVETVEPLVSAADVLVASEAGAAALDAHATPTARVHGLAAAHDLETVVLARDERGAVGWHDATVYERTPPLTDVIDRRGAFDAACGGFLARRLAGDGPGQALATGVACGALARTTRGSMATVTPAAVERCVASTEANRGEGTDRP